MIVTPELDWSNIDTVLLDMDGTLLDLHFDSHFWLEHLPLRYATIHQLPPEQAKDWLHQRLAREQGTLNWYCLDYWSHELQVDIVALKQEVAERIAFRPSVRQFLQRLRAAGKRTLIVTNAHPDSLLLKLERTDLATLVDDIICSHHVAVAKEEPVFWHKLQQQEAFDPDRTLLIDDSQSVLHSAKAYGIRYLLAIAQPDSQHPPRATGDYPALHHFDHITPEPETDEHH